MSRARVLLDQLLQLGEGERAGAAAVLAEAFAADPALLREALALTPADYRGEPIRDALRIATPWEPSYGYLWTRRNLLTGAVLAEVLWRRDRFHIRIRQREVDADYETLQEAQATADEGLAGWHLL